MLAAVALENFVQQKMRWAMGMMYLQTISHLATLLFVEIDKEVGSTK